MASEPGCPTIASPPLLGTARCPRSPVGSEHQLSHCSSMLRVELVPVATIFTTYLKIKKCYLMILVNVCHRVYSLPHVGSRSPASKLPAGQQDHQPGAFGPIPPALPEQAIIYSPVSRVERHPGASSRLLGCHGNQEVVVLKQVARMSHMSARWGNSWMTSLQLVAVV